jgi:putative two-component system response regulator
VSVTRDKRQVWRESVSVGVLVVDDDPAAASSVSQVLQQQGYRTLLASDTDDARRRLRQGGVNLVVCDVRLPSESGLSLAQEIARDHPEVGVVMMSGWGDLRTADAAFESGADTFLAKPFRADELVIAVSTALRQLRSRVESRFVHSRLEEDVAHLRIALSEVNSSLADARRDMLTRLAFAAECRIPGMGGHLGRVGAMVRALTAHMGWEPERAELVGAAATLHDVGKIAIPDQVLLKRGPLTGDERRAMQRHALIGHEMLAGSDDPLLEMAATIALAHHERADGSGYPYGLSGDSIPVEASVVAVVDVFDALLSTRPHRDSMTVPEALAEMTCGRGGLLHELPLATLVANVDDLLGIRRVSEVGIAGE